MTDNETALRLHATLERFVQSLSKDERLLFDTVLEFPSDVLHVLESWERSKAEIQAAFEAVGPLPLPRGSDDYQRLQLAMQKENQMYTAISNVMKTKHETVKNSISNIR